MQKEYKQHGFPVVRDAKIFYQLKQGLISELGKMVLDDYSTVRAVAHKINQKRDVIDHRGKIVKAGELNAIYLITNILQHMIEQYVHKNPKYNFQVIYQYLEEKFNKSTLENCLVQYEKEYINNKTISDNVVVENSAFFLKEILIVWLTNKNQAFENYKDLYDDLRYNFNTHYHKIIDNINKFFESELESGSESLNLITLLQAPAKASPYSITGQLDFIRNNWGEFIPEEVFSILSGLDFLKEEEKVRFLGPGPTETLKFQLEEYSLTASSEEEPEQFTPDRDWMPRLVMIAKSTYVWLDQLSKKYNKDVHRLDEIPEAEFELLQKRGITGLWLIGLWERSHSSEWIKHRMGNHEAIASAYSLKNYEVANALGGEEAFQKFKENAWKYQVRVACDMVPNHMGLDSHLLVDHPDWFIQVPKPPYPAYTFHSENLSPYPEIEIHIEDHYYDQTDAAVVFKLYDKRDHQTRYIYHGNDGTSVPWNDTAQLNYLIKDVRESVINEIINIAKKFPIIRFDAAMTLAKKHYQRLWFPVPGSGGDIPSRSEFSMTKKEFDEAFPIEFWREVVDRAAVEAPDTLLLAEAFWMMEGYFVRTLGMHRVYNSAFMNMLKNEENTKYKESIKNVMEFNPEILKRFVNFMSNPDEETAIAQFGKDDKYFGVCILMITMPGLPMFAHGQIEGFTERYGMEFSRAKWDEKVDEFLVERHKKEIFPILKKRYIFAEVENFMLYDFITLSGHQNDNVFAYSNEYEGEKALVIYHNKYEGIKGWIQWANSVQKNSTNELHWIRKNLGEALALDYDQNKFVIFKDLVRNLEYIRNSKEIFSKGLFLDLHAYEYVVLSEFRQVVDDQDNRYLRLAEYLQGGGVPNVDEAMKKTFLLPVLNSFKKVIRLENILKIHKLRNVKTKEYKLYLNEYLKADINNFLSDLIAFKKSEADIDLITESILTDLENLIGLPWDLTLEKSCLSRKIVSYYHSSKRKERLDYCLILWVLTHRIGEIKQIENSDEVGCSWYNELLIGEQIQNNIPGIIPDYDPELAKLLIQIVIQYQNIWKLLDEKTPFEIMKIMVNDSDVYSFIDINCYKEVLWFNKERFEDILILLYLTNYISILQYCNANEKDCKKILVKFNRFYEKFVKAKENSDYKVEKLLLNLEATEKKSKK